VLCDRGYDSDHFRNKIRKQKCAPVIPVRRNRTVQIDYDKYLYRGKNLIERLFSKIKYHRHIFSRFDKTLQSFMGFLSFAGAILWLK